MTLITPLPLAVENYDSADSLWSGILFITYFLISMSLLKYFRYAIQTKGTRGQVPESVQTSIKKKKVSFCGVKAPIPNLISDLDEQLNAKDKKSWNYALRCPVCLEVIMIGPRILSMTLL